MRYAKHIQTDFCISLKRCVKKYYLCLVKKLYSILSISVLLLVLANCTSNPKPWYADKPYNASPELLHIDSLMWLHPDSATRELSKFCANYNIDSSDVFNKHYFDLLVSELRFKNGIPQNRGRLLKAVDYFDTWL